MKNEDADELLKENKSHKKQIKERERLPSAKKNGPIPFSSDYIYRTLFRMSPFTIVVSGLEDGRIYDVSDTFCIKSGYSREEAVGKTGHELKLWLDTNREEFIRLVLKEGGYRKKEVKHRLRDGSIITCLESVELVTIGKEHYIILITTDITEMTNTKESLITERDLNDTIINSLPGFFYILDEELRFLRWNENLIKTTGYSAEQMRRMTIMDFHPEEERMKVVEDTIKSFRLGENKSEATVVMKDGTARTFFFSSRRFLYQNKNCIVGTGMDITEQKQIEKEMQYYAENLEDANIALRVLMNQKNTDRQGLEEKLQANVNDLVIPYVQKLRKSNLDDRQKNFLNILENHLRDVLSPFVKNFRSSHKNLTPQEIQIVDLIKQGKKTKEIAEILNASVKTVETHRNNIRKKMNLVNAKVNLRSHILSL